jgi:hypothetical protein
MAQQEVIGVVGMDEACRQSQKSQRPPHPDQPRLPSVADKNRFDHHGQLH